MALKRTESAGSNNRSQAAAGAFTCPACYQGPMRAFYEIAHVPVNSCILLNTVDEARAFPTGHIELGFCDECGMIANMTFDAEKIEYSGRYEETQGFSGVFSRFHKALVERLIERYNLRGKNVLEIGCGKGEFILLLAELGNNHGIGIDPGVDMQRISGKGGERVRFIADFYSEKYADPSVDFVACKMTLEHIPDVEQFVSTVRRGLGEQHNTIAFFQVPEAMRILRNCAFEDIYHEHCAYFTLGSLVRLFRRCGFDVINIETEYAGQYLTIEARPRAPGAAPTPTLAGENDIEELRCLVLTFADRCAAKVKMWAEHVDRCTATGQKIVLWGSGSKAVSLLTALGPSRQLPYVTDISPYRHNHYMPNTGQRIMPPGELREVQPDVVIAMNPVYVDEIRKDLLEMGLTPEILSL